MVLGALAAVGAACLFWNATRQHWASVGMWRGAWGLACVCLALMLFTSPPGPAPSWVTNAIESTFVLSMLGMAAAVVVSYIEQSRAYRKSIDEGVPALRAHWPTGLVAAVSFAICLAGVWLTGQGITAFGESVLNPLLTSLDPAQVNSPDVTHALEVITALMTIVVLTPVVLTFALPLIIAHLHRRRIHAERETFIREIVKYEDRHPLPTGAVDHGMLA